MKLIAYVSNINFKGGLVILTCLWCALDGSDPQTETVQVKACSPPEKFNEAIKQALIESAAFKVDNSDEILLIGGAS